MPFATDELSTQDGKPVLLLRFRRGSTDWRYTTADRDITYLGNVYLSSPILVEDLLYTGDAKSESLGLEAPSGIALTDYLDTGAVSSTVYVFIHRVHMTETPSTGTFAAPGGALDAPVVWVGEVYSYQTVGVNRRRLNCNTRSVSMARNGLRLTWGRQCNNALYLPGCNVNRVAFRRSLVGVTVVDGAEVRVSNLTGAARPGVVNGTFEWTMAGGVVESKGIEAYRSSGGYGYLTLFGGTRGVAGGSSYRWYPGCNRLIDTCHSLFNNSDNFGGIKYLQGENPFDGKAIYY